MDRRDFLKGVGAVGAASLLDPRYLHAKEKLQSATGPIDSVPRRRYGRTAEMISLIGFGGIVVRDVTSKEASDYVAEAVDRGVNYFDVAPTYGNAQDRLGPALKPFREKYFLACKTAKRDAAGARKELETSLRTNDRSSLRLPGRATRSLRRRSCFSDADELASWCAAHTTDCLTEACGLAKSDRVK